MIARGLYDFSSTSKSRMLLLPSPTTPNLTAHIRFLVNVPVLSEQIVEVQPRVSTEGSLLTIQLF